MAARPWIDRAIGWLAPGVAVERARARMVLAHYEAADAKRTLRKIREGGSGNVAVARAGRSLREQARHLEQNHDLAIGALTTLTAAIVGPGGIGIEPRPRRADGSIHQDAAAALRLLWRDWQRSPEVTWQMDWAAVQRMLVRSWLRDGEVFAEMVQGNSLSGYRHGTRVPLSLHLMEADFCPLELSDTGRRLVQGIEHDRWGRPTRYHFYEAHPADTWQTTSSVLQSATRPVPASRVLHLALRDRLHQVRGVSVFHAVLERLEDLKDYEESERVAAKVAASMAAYIKKGTADLYAPPGEDGTAPRNMRFAPGMIFDDLMPGEEIGTIDTARPSAQLEPHRKGQLRAVAAGTFCTYSSLARDYDGTYSAQRQEMVEGYGVYGQLQSAAIGDAIQPVYERVVMVAQLANLLPAFPDVVAESWDDALYIAPAMPWIDPAKEAAAWEKLEQNTYASGPEIIRRRGHDPHDVLEQQAAWQADKARALGEAAPTTITEAPNGSVSPIRPRR